MGDRRRFAISSLPQACRWHRPRRCKRLMTNPSGRHGSTSDPSCPVPASGGSPQHAFANAALGKSPSYNPRCDRRTLRRITVPGRGQALQSLPRRCLHRLSLSLRAFHAGPEPASSPGRRIRPACDAWASGPTHPLTSHACPEDPCCPAVDGKTASMCHHARKSVVRANGRGKKGKRPSCGLARSSRRACP